MHIEADTLEKNKQLIEKYPFLLPHNRWTDTVPEDYNYSYTELDDMPSGWRLAFGEQMCEDLKNIFILAQERSLKHFDYLPAYRILQIKEKYGGLRWYDTGCPEIVEKEYKAWLDKYESLSQVTCFICGKPSTITSDGWIEHYCHDCFVEETGREPYECEIDLPVTRYNTLEK